MWLLDFFKTTKKESSETIKREKPSEEQTFFADTVLKVFNPTLENFGYKRHKTEVKTYSSCLVWRKEEKYIKIESTSYPTDYFYNVVLGEGDSDDFFEYDWNSIALWRLKKTLYPERKAQEYEFPLDEKVESSILKANNDLLKYGHSFLNDKLEYFYEARTEQNKDRKPYKIHTPNQEGIYITEAQPKSVKQKEKYS